MIKVGITGQSGFIGTHLYNYLSLFKNDFTLIQFEDKYFETSNLLAEFVSKCDVIIHLAAVNRHYDQEEIYSKNIELVDKLISALSFTKSKASVLFSSSTQENRNNQYGRSKKEGREKLIEWAKNYKNGFIGMVIPNVFGPFGKPFYNSVISTFSYQLINDEIPKIEIDADLNLIYVTKLCEIIRTLILNNTEKIIEEFIIPHTITIRVSDILEKLKVYKENYIVSGIIPKLETDFDRSLFNTFRSYINYKTFYPFYYKKNEDERGIFVETMKLNIGGQVSYSTTKPGITRGNHFHTRKIERFAVIKGNAKIQLRKYNSNEIIEFILNGNDPSFVDMPVWFTHNITNIGDDDLITFFWINEFYNPEDTDTYFEKV